jgi:hypothetical protein
MARAFRIGFLGNCYIFGYRGVAARATYPEILRRRIEAERPGVRVRLMRSALFHPADMPRQVTRLMAKQPDVIIVDAAATPVVSILKPRVDVRGLPAGAARLVDGMQQGLTIVKGMSERNRVMHPVLHAVDRVSRLVVDARSSRSRATRRRAWPTTNGFWRKRSARDQFVYDADRARAVLAGQRPSARRTSAIARGPSRCRSVVDASMLMRWAYPMFLRVAKNGS